MPADRTSRAVTLLAIVVVILLAQATWQGSAFTRSGHDCRARQRRVGRGRPPRRRGCDPWQRDEWKRVHAAK